MLDDDGEPSVSQERANAYGEGLWAVYEPLPGVACPLAPKVAPVRASGRHWSQRPVHLWQR